MHYLTVFHKREEMTGLDHSVGLIYFGIWD